WWLNIACAYRDGFVTTDLEKPTIREHDERSTLPLLTGEEEILSDFRVKYIRTGNRGDVHVSLLTQVGKKVHLIRGYKLKSDLAPTAGLRYDGLWTIKSYSQKLDLDTDLYRMELVLESFTSLSSSTWAVVKAVPLPSQRDDWHLYLRLEGEKIRQSKGELTAFDWRIREEADKAEREDAQRVRNFRSSIGSAEHAVISRDVSAEMLQQMAFDHQKRLSGSAAAWGSLARTP
ncbi:hypothetical protein V8F20_007229, partial [Naviculisporaceae sp. PSN 640]